ncbi:MAG: hypothetical protein EAX90_01750 [Candidatus Heimdallarchaeota archaeon]|nr:hypothetical protein [Candidatus Heimdallarchaeota archaeon]
MGRICVTIIDTTNNTIPIIEIINAAVLYLFFPSIFLVLIVTKSERIFNTINNIEHNPTCDILRANFETSGFTIFISSLDFSVNTLCSISVFPRLIQSTL